MGKKLLYPWSTNKYAGDPDGKVGENVIYNKLRERAFPVGMTKPDKEVLDRVLRVMKVLLKRKLVEKKAPWVVLLSNDPAWLALIVDVVPMMWAYTFKKSVCKVKTGDVIGSMKFGTRSFVDSGEDKETAAIMAYRSHLVAWQHINIPYKGSEQFEGNVLDLLDIRTKGELLPRLFTIAYAEKHEGTVQIQKACREVEDALGRSVANMIRTQSHWMRLHNRDLVESSIIFSDG